MTIDSSLEVAVAIMVVGESLDAGSGLALLEGNLTRFCELSAHRWAYVRDTGDLQSLRGGSWLAVLLEASVDVAYLLLGYRVYQILKQ